MHGELSPQSESHEGGRGRRMKSIKSDIAYNLIGNLAPLLCAAVFIPGLMRELGAERFGVMTILWALVGYFGVFDLGVSRALTYHAAKATAPGSTEPLAPTVRAGVQVVTLAGLAGLLAILLSEEWIAAQLLSPSSQLTDEARLALVITALTIPVTTLGNGLRGVLEGMARFSRAAWIKAATGASFFAGPALLAALGFGGLAEIAASFLVVRAATAILCWMSIRHDTRYSLSRRMPVTPHHRRALLSYGVWALLSSVISPLMVYGDRFVISKMMGAAHVGIYAVLQEMLGRTLLLAASFATAILPRFVHGYGEHERAQYLKFEFLFGLVLAVFYVAVGLAALPVGEWWLGQDLESYRLIFTLFTVALFINSLAQLPYFFVMAKGMPSVPAKIHILEFVLYVPACIAATSIYGLQGAAGTWVVRVAIDYLLLRWFAHKILTS